ncbi:MAG: 1-acyl-sn-glycerol-3-phosphate acyltransferase [Spirochaetales bacterium]|nr:1-acyl-sn-glycerol-3-phosphate acyltransferase [Spirochaetales bacterium]
MKNDTVGKMQKGEKRMYLINHSSIYDVILAYILPGASRFVIKDKWIKKPFVGWIQQLAGNVVVGEDKPEKHQIADGEPDSIMETVKAFEQEMPIVVFPEGTRSKNGQIQRFKRGAFKIGLTGQIDFVPVVMDDWNCVRPTGSGIWIRDIRPHITILPAIKYENYKHLTHAELAKLMRYIMTKKLYEMREERKAANKKDYRHAAKFVEEDKKVKESLEALKKELEEKNIKLNGYQYE